MTFRHGMLGLGLMMLCAGTAACSGGDEGDGDAETDVAPADDARREDADALESTDDGAPVACHADEECRDDVFCNGEERCADGACAAGVDPCDDHMDCTIDTCDESADRCDNAPSDDACQDGLACNGRETCVLGAGCAPGEPPECDDGSACTIDTCQDAAGGCLHTPRDLDGDTFLSDDFDCAAEGGDDCDDVDPAVHPEAVEVCDDGRDNDCDTLTDFADEPCGPTNDTCANAMLLEEGITVNGSTRGAVSEIMTACGGDRDVVFAIDLAENRDLFVDVVGAGGAYLSADLQRACGDPATSLACVDGSPAALRRNTLSAGRYYVIVKSGEVDFSITYRTADPTPPGYLTLTGVARDFPGTPVFGATVTVAEDASLTATTGADGRFTLYVPPEAPLTLHSSCAGYVDTISQTAILHTDTSTRVWMATPDQYALIVSSGGGSPSDAAFYISLVVMSSVGCDLTGSIVTTEPPTGRVVYAQADGYPNGTLTSVPSGGRGAYVIGPTGTVTPRIAPTTCAMTPFPADLGPVTVLGPVAVQPGALHIMDLYVE